MLANDLYLHDGFQESFKFRGHRLQIRGFNSLESYDGKTRNQSQQNNEIRAKEIYISWDIKQVLLWEQNYSDADNLRVVSTLRFPKNQPNFISAIVNIPRLKIFVAAALDMSFKIYDKNLHLLESIKHHERAILQMEYDGEKDLFITSGGSGISLWRIIRVVSLDIAHVVEKLYSFEECSSWVGKMIYEPSANRIYAIIDRNAQVFSFSKKRMIHELVDTHTSPLTVVCWYERNQFYLTGCR